MAIQYIVTGPGTYLATGLSTDSKPTGMVDSCCFLEIDTAKWYRSLNGSWVEISNEYYQKEIKESVTPPSSPEVGDLWMDTSN